MIIELLQKNFGSEIIQISQEKDQVVVILRKDKCHDVLKFLKEDPTLDFSMMLDLCGVDFLKTKENPRFEVVYHLYSLTHHHRIRVRVQVPEEDMKVPTITDLWRAADWFERETWEMFGVEFVGHPHLKNLLLFDGFEGNPLRKDYPIAKRQKIPVAEGKLT